MRKKTLFTSLALVGLLGISGLAGVFSEKKVSEAHAADPAIGTIETDIKQTYIDSGTSDEYYHFADGSNLPLYVNGSVSSIATMTVRTGTATEQPKIRHKVSNSGQSNETHYYYLYLKYGKEKTVGAMGSYVDFAASGNYVFTDVSIPTIYQGKADFSVYTSNDRSNWTKVHDGVSTESSLSLTLPSASKYVRFAQVKYTGDAQTNSYFAFDNISLDFEDPTNIKTVSFDSQGGTSVESQIVPVNSTATQPADPTRAAEGTTIYHFNGWHTDPTEDSPFSFSTPITNNITLYAHWTPEVVTGWVLTFDSRGGTAVESQIVALDGSEKFVKPANPTRAADSFYTYSFGKWYNEPECTSEFDFNATPSANVTAYAGYTRTGTQPSGYSAIDPKKDIATWGASYKNVYSAAEFNSRETFDTKAYYPAMHWSISASGESNAGFQNKGDSTFVLNSADVVITITDLAKYFSNIRFEFQVLTYSESTVKEVTIKSNGVAISDTGILPHNSTTRSALVLDVDCSSKPREMYFHIGYMSSKGVRLRHLYVQSADYTAEEQAINFATAFNDANVCGTSSTDGVNDTKWAAQLAAWGTISNQAKAIFSNYSGSNAEIIECLERYDRVIYLHGSDYDFMDRVTTDHIPVKSIVNLHDTLFGNETNYISIVVIIGLVTSVSIIGLLKYRRKHQ